MSTLPETTSLLRIILDCHDLFPQAHRALPSLVIKLVVDEAKSNANLAFFSELNRRFGKRELALLLDAVPSTTLGKAVKAADKDNPDLRGATPDWLRERLIFLADGGAPYKRPPRPPARTRATKTEAANEKKKSPVKKETNPTKARSSKAKWDGKNRDAEPE